VLESFRDTGGIERLMDYIFYQAAAINGFDAVGHYLRAGCSSTSARPTPSAPVAGCSANFPQPRVRVGARPRPRVDAAGDDRCCARPRSRSRGRSARRSRRPRPDGGPKRQAPARRKAKRARGKPRQPCRRAPARRPRGRAAAVPTAGPRRAGAAAARADAGRPTRHADAHADPATRCSTTCSARTAADESARRRHRGQPVLIGAATVLVILVASSCPTTPTRACRSSRPTRSTPRCPSAAQLVVGNDVKIGGSRVGAVTEIKPKTEDERQRDRGAHAHAGQGRRTAAHGLDAARAPALALGLKYVEVTRGKSSETYQDGDTIALRRPRRRSSSTSS
jgi:hypothetical protein